MQLDMLNVVSALTIQTATSCSPPPPSHPHSRPHPPEATLGLTTCLPAESENIHQTGHYQTTGATVTTVTTSQHHPADVAVISQPRHSSDILSRQIELEVRSQLQVINLYPAAGIVRQTGRY